VQGELALDANGKFLALRLDWIAEIGAYMTPPAAGGTIRNPIVSFTGAYRIPALYGRFRVALTNAAPR
jgi:aerobic carbon-monoxide dehydrogenase large subunit